MRVLQVNSFFYERAGGEAHFMDLLELLDREGHEVSVVAMDHPSNAACRWPHQWVPYVAHEAGLGIWGSARAFGRSIYSPDVARRVESFAKSRRVDVAHLHGIHHHLSLGVVDGLCRASVPIVWTLHDYRTVCPASSLLRDGSPCEACSHATFWHAMRWRCRGGSSARSLAVCAESYWAAWASRYERVDCFIAPSRFLARKVLEMGLPARRMEVVRNPLPVESARSGLERSGLLYVGRLSKEKGVDVLIRATARVPAARLTVVGDGPERARLEELASSLKAKVDFLGWLDRGQVPAVMNGSAILCVPSIWYENCPVVVLEAMSTGLPVAVSDIGGLPELARHGECGVIVPPGSVAGWARLARDVSQRPWMCEGLAERATESLRVFHSPHGSARQITRVYRDVIDAARDPEMVASLAGRRVNQLGTAHQCRDDA
jgi:glycosyltransferase involved in cell wall biosynthesis